MRDSLDISMATSLLVLTFLLVIFLPGKYALRFIGVVILSAAVLYELTPPEPISQQNIGYTLGIMFILFVVIAFLIVAMLKTSIHLGLRKKRGKKLFLPSAIDTPVMGVVGLAFGFLTITTGSRFFNNTQFDILAHFFVLSVAILGVFISIKPTHGQPLKEFHRPPVYLFAGIFLTVAVGLLVSIWHISSVTKAAKHLSKNKAYCITHVASKMDMSFLTMKKFLHPSLVVARRKQLLVFTWSFRLQNFEPATWKWHCIPKPNFIEKLPIFKL